MSSLPSLKAATTVLLVLSSAALPLSSQSAPAVEFKPSAMSVDRFDFVEIVASVSGWKPANAFRDATFSGVFQLAGGTPVSVDGFADSDNGSVYRIRFMPMETGAYSYQLSLKLGTTERQFSGTFEAKPGQHKGMVRVDKAYPFHFVWQGTGEHYFYNSTTTYFLSGWDDANIRQSIDRFARLKVNRLRVTLNGRVRDARVWGDNVYPTPRFSFLVCPWKAERPASVEDPGIDRTRFNLELWRKFERMLAYARERDIVISVIFYLDGYRPGADPFGKQDMGGADEQAYYRYAIARFGAYSNVMWDLANEYRLFRNDAWAEQMGAFVKRTDPYRHLTSVHGHGEFRFASSPWADFAMIQSWDEWGGHQKMLGLHAEEKRTGRPMPQVNEEYGYEDDYPVGWGESRQPPARNAESRRKLAWGMYMASGYQTTGERADRGTGWGPDSGGGWVNGRGDSTMTMLEGFARIRAFFESFEWWTAEPHDDLVNKGAMCIANPGKLYAAYLPEGGSVMIKLDPGVYRVRGYNPRTGTWTDFPDTPAGEATFMSLISAEPGDAAVVLTRR